MYAGTAIPRNGGHLEKASGARSLLLALLLVRCSPTAPWNVEEEIAVRTFARKTTPATRCRGADGRPWKVLDVGGRVVNQFSGGTHGTRAIFERMGCAYVCMDISNGTGVDIVQEPGKPFPFGERHFDVVVTISTFEHDPMYWVTVREMARVTRVGGYVYVNTPSAGKYHPWPGDCWRHLGDSGAALALWCGTSFAGVPAYPLALLEARFDRGQWHESISVFRRTSTPAVALTVEASGLPCASGSARTGTCGRRYNVSAPLPASGNAAEAIERFARGLPAPLNVANGGSRRHARVLRVAGNGSDPEEARVQLLWDGRDYTYRYLDGRRQPGAPFPFPDGHFDFSIATAVSNDPFHWMTIREMARTTRLGGKLLVFAASGVYYPSIGDYVRYYADAAAALAFWCGKPFGDARPYPLALASVSGGSGAERGLPSTMEFDRTEAPAPWFTIGGLRERGLLQRGPGPDLWRCKRRYYRCTL